MTTHDDDTVEYINLSPTDEGYANILRVLEESISFHSSNIDESISIEEEISNLLDAYPGELYHFKSAAQMLSDAFVEYRKARDLDIKMLQASIDDINRYLTEKGLPLT